MHCGEKAKRERSDLAFIEGEPKQERSPELPQKDKPGECRELIGEHFTEGNAERFYQIIQMKGDVDSGIVGHPTGVSLGERREPVEQADLEKDSQ